MRRPLPERYPFHRPPASPLAGLPLCSAPRASIPLKAYVWAVVLAIPAWIVVFGLIKLGMSL